MCRNLLLVSLFVCATAALGQELDRDAPFVLGWNGHFAHGKTVHLNGSGFPSHTSASVAIAIGDHPDFEQCTRRENQIASGWDERTATFEVEAENFSTGEQVYVFLIGQDGSVSRGHEVTLGDQIPHPEGPGQPGVPTLVQ